MKLTADILKEANIAKLEIQAADTEKKNEALRLMAECLLKDTELILAANETDIEKAKGIISDVMIDRLRLTKERIEAMADGMREVALLEDPVGDLLDTVIRPNGLQIQKMRVPMGVIAIIYESRPNVTSDAAALAIKAGSACILRSGKEAHASAKAICEALQKGLQKAGLPKEVLSLVEDTSRQSAEDLMKARGQIDLLIPRGGKNLIRACVENALVPVIETGTGICHIFADETCDQEKALSIIENAKTSRPSVCNAMEVCLVHEKICLEFLPKLKACLVDKRIEKGLTPVELILDEKASLAIPGTRASEDSFDTEFLDYKMAIHVVKDVEEAVHHISEHSTGHSESILTENKEHADYFIKRIDSAAVYVNASTRFTDGGEFGLGCEMGISTQKLHARGPMGLRELCTYKYVIIGDGQIR